jgi:hypothetical protein
VRSLFDFIEPRDDEILHRNVTFALSNTEQSIATEPEVPHALAGSEVCRRRKEGPVKIGLRPPFFKTTRAPAFASALNAPGNPSVFTNALPGAASRLKDLKVAHIEGLTHDITLPFNSVSSRLLFHALGRQKLDAK